MRDLAQMVTIVIMDISDISCVMKKYITCALIPLLTACSGKAEESSTEHKDQNEVRIETVQGSDFTEYPDTVSLVGECASGQQSEYVFILLPNDLQINKERYFTKVSTGDTVCSFYRGEIVKSVIISSKGDELNLSPEDSQILDQIKEEGQYLIAQKLESEEVIDGSPKSCSAYELKMEWPTGFKLVVANSDLSKWQLGCYNDVAQEYTDPFITEYYRYGEVEFYCKMLYAPEHTVASVFIQGDTSEIFQFYYP